MHRRTPSRRDLLVFACGVPLVGAFVGVERWHAGATDVARGWWIAAAVAALALGAWPAARRGAYRAWMTATAPIAWLVARALLALVWLAVATPTALVLRALGRDPLARGFDRDAPSYWIRRERAHDPERAFRQT